MMEQFKVSTPPYAAVLDEALTKYSGFNTETSLAEYIELQNAIEHQQSNIKMSKEAAAKKRIALELVFIHTVRVN